MKLVASGRATALTHGSETSKKAKGEAPVWDQSKRAGKAKTYNKATGGAPERDLSVSQRPRRSST